MRNYERGNAVLGGVLVLGVIGLFFGALSLFTSLYTNSDTERAVEMNMGEFHQITGPGEHWKMPFITSVRKYDVGRQELLVGKGAKQDRNKAVSTSSADNYDFYASVLVAYYLPEERIEWVHRNMPNYQTRLRSIAVDKFKIAARKYDMKDLAKQREKLSRDALDLIKMQAKHEIGVEVIDVSLPYYGLSSDFLKHREQRKQAQTNKEVAERNEKKAEIIQRTKTMEVEAEAERKELRAQADANAKMIAAQAEADATRIQGEADAAALAAKQKVLERAPNLVEYERVLRWDGKLPKYSLGSSGVMMQMAPDNSN